jgi:hypothetical protein
LLGPAAAVLGDRTAAGLMLMLRIDRRARYVLIQGWLSSCSTEGRLLASFVSAEVMKDLACSDMERGKAGVWDLIRCSTRSRLVS